jgi:hypothetical protein
MAMTIEIRKPELEALIAERLECGTFESVEDVLLQALKSSPPRDQAGPPKHRRPSGRKSLAQLFAESPFKGLDLDFEREQDFGRDIDL